jgi:acyl dehydratase
MEFDLAALEQWSEDREFKVQASRTTAYAAATNDTNPKHTAGELAPPLFAVVPVWEAIGPVVARVTPSEALMRVVHGAQDIVFHRPIVPGDVLRSRAAPVGIGVRSSGTTLVVKTESRDAAGELVNEQYYTLFFRGVGNGQGGGRMAPEHKLTAEIKTPPPVAEATYPIDADQTFRYADASGDRMPIHLDDALARAVGLPGIIVHGLCTMAFAGRAVVEEVAGGDSARLRRLAMRFSRPLLPGQTITTRIYDGGPLPAAAGASGPVHAFAFETLNPEGQAAGKDGWAEVAT